jgi:hypothetical protein
MVDLLRDRLAAISFCCLPAASGQQSGDLVSFSQAEVSVGIHAYRLFLVGKRRASYLASPAFRQLYDCTSNLNPPSSAAWLCAQLLGLAVLYQWSYRYEAMESRNYG